ncbi:MAG: polysaccharide biosynthesis/export family protein, partial [Spartobacteria bacterium]
LWAVFIFLGVAASGLAEIPSDYKLSPNDLVDFRVFQEPELDSVVRISGEGQANFPLIGVVEIGGKTTAEATEILKSRYRGGYLVNPQITLTVRSYAKKLFTILGQVQRPGAYDIIGNSQITLLQAIGMAGGYTKIADPANVTIKRMENGREEVLKFNAKRMLRGDDPTALLIKPGDVISVGESLF